MPNLTSEDIAKGKELAAAWREVEAEVHAKPELLERSPNLLSSVCWIHAEHILLGKYHGAVGPGTQMMISWLAARGYTEGACLKQFVDDCEEVEVESGL